MSGDHQVLVGGHHPTSHALPSRVTVPPSFPRIEPMPRKPTWRRLGPDLGACSPMPAVNTSVSIPPSTAARRRSACAPPGRTPRRPARPAGPPAGPWQQLPHVARAPDRPSRPDSWLTRWSSGRRRSPPRQQVHEHAGVEVAGAGAHHDAAGRREAHRRVDRAAVADGAQAGAAAEVGDHGPAEPVGADRLDDVLVGQAVEAVAAHARRPRAAPAAAKRARHLGERAVERGVEARHLRARPEPAAAPPRCRRARPAGAAGRTGPSARRSASTASSTTRGPGVVRVRRARPGGRPTCGSAARPRRARSEHLDRARPVRRRSPTTSPTRPVDVALGDTRQLQRRRAGVDAEDDAAFRSRGQVQSATSGMSSRCSLDVSAVALEHVVAVLGQLRRCPSGGAGATGAAPRWPGGSGSSR